MARKVRVPGGYTVFHWSNDGEHEQVIGFAQNVQVTGVRPVAPPEVIQPLNALRPVEIVTPRASTYGTIILTLTELYNEAIWQRLAGLAGSRDIIDIMEYVAGLDNGIRITKYVRPPVGNDYSETFFNCVVADMDEGETVAIDTMRLEKTLTLWYTYSLKNYPNIPKTARPATFT